MQRLLALDIALLRANTVAQAVQALYRSLEQDFGLQQYRLVLAAAPHNKAKIPPALCVADERAKAEIAAMEVPVLGSKISPALRALLPADGKVAESFCNCRCPSAAEPGRCCWRQMKMWRGLVKICPPNGLCAWPKPWARCCRA